MLKSGIHKVVGIVAANNWTKDGSVIGIKICADGEVNYTVRPSKVGDQLLRSLTGRVEVLGDVSQGSNGELFISVTSFKNLEHKDLGTGPNLGMLSINRNLLSS